MLKLAEYLLKNGCDVHVLCARTGHSDDYGYGELLANLKVTYVDDALLLLGARLLGAKDSQPGARSTGRIGLGSRLKRLVLEVLTPDTAVLMVGRMAAIARDIIARNPSMTIITSGPPHSVHLVGRSIKKRFASVQWIVDYRDSWNGTPLFRKRSGLLQLVNERMERSVLSLCDRFTYISKPMLAKANLLSGLALDSRSDLIANGFDVALLDVVTGPQARSGPLRIGYFGAIDDSPESYRNPECIFQVLEDAPALSVALELYGSIRISEQWRSRLGERLMVGPTLSHREAIEKMREMDVLLLLHTRDDGADEVITGKVFEYMVTGLPILSVGPSQMAVNDVFLGDPSFFPVEHRSRSSIASVLSRLVEDKACQRMPVRDRNRVASWSRDSQFAGFLSLIDRWPR